MILFVVSLAALVYLTVLAAVLLWPFPCQSLVIYLNWLNWPLFVDWKGGAESFGYRSESWLCSMPACPRPAGVCMCGSRALTGCLTAWLPDRLAAWLPVWLLRAAGGVRSVYIKTSDGLTLGAWHVLPRRAAPLPRPGVLSATDDSQSHHHADLSLKSAERVYLYFHGNAGNRATFHRNDFYKMMTGFGSNHHVLAIDYRGFGDSSPAFPRESTVALDAIAAYDWLVARGVPPAKIVLVGHSLGTGVATDLAYYLTTRFKSSPKPVFGGLVLLSAYASIGDAAIGYPMVPLLAPFRGWHVGEKWIKSRMIDRWDSVHKIRSIRAPILIIHGKADFEIRPWQGRALFLEAAGGRIGKKLVQDDGYWQLRRSPLKFSARELPDVIVTELSPEEGDLWSLDAPADPASPVWFLEVAHAGHNTLSKFQVVNDTIDSWNRTCLHAST
ncbi:Alpha/Beta hydrolase protein [Entophlyctis helioformis]|nr:Alpha/Beta hydrolase protein [Entophlyctis helioformis]